MDKLDSNCPTMAKARKWLWWPSVRLGAVLGMQLGQSTCWVGGCFDRVEELHGLDIVQVDLIFKNNH